MKLEELPEGKIGQVLKNVEGTWRWVDMTEEDEKKIWDSIHEDENF